MSPSTKVTAGGAAGAIVTLIIFLIGFADVAIPPEVASAAVVLLSWPLAYLVRETRPAPSAIEAVHRLDQARALARHGTGTSATTIDVTYQPGENEPDDGRV
jgi:hypothetical protein